MWKAIGFAGYLALLSICDWRKRSLPRLLLAAGGMLLLGYMTWCLLETPYRWDELGMAWGIGSLPGILLLAFSGVTGKIGTGDGCVLIMVGVLMGVQFCLMVFSWSLLLAAIYAGFLLVFRKAGKGASFAYVPFLTAAYCLQLLGGA